MLNRLKRTAVAWLRRQLLDPTLEQRVRDLEIAERRRAQLEADPNRRGGAR